MALPTESLMPAFPIGVDVPLTTSVGVPLSSLAPGHRATVLDVDSSTLEGRRLLAET